MQAEAHIQIISEILEGELVKKQDLLNSEKSLETSIGQLESRVDASIKRLEMNINRLDTKIDSAVERLEHKIIQSEYRSTIKLGSIVTVVVTVATAVIKFL